MPQQKHRRSSLAGWIISAVLIAASYGLWTERQFVVDAIQYSRYQPSEAVEQLASTAGLTDDARFTFYASQPAVQSSEVFNNNCERREADSPILGCYSAKRIYIFDVTDQRLEGIKAVTAAHELLHAEYDRLPESEKKRLDTLLTAEYEKTDDSSLQDRMDYYAKTEPGQSLNELHSIVGTEFKEISPELERHYSRYFTNRQALVSLQEQVNQQFRTLSEEADQLVTQIEKLAFSINQDTKEYNDEISSLNDAVDEFNRTASRTGGFTTQDEFEAARARLVARNDQLATLRQQIQADVATYKTLLTQLDAINAESAALNQGLDSISSDVPQL